MRKVPFFQVSMLYLFCIVRKVLSIREDYWINQTRLISRQANQFFSLHKRAPLSHAPFRTKIFRRPNSYNTARFSERPSQFRRPTGSGLDFIKVNKNLCLMFNRHLIGQPLIQQRIEMIFDPVQYWLFVTVTHENIIFVIFSHAILIQPEIGAESALPLLNAASMVRFRHHLITRLREDKK